MKCPTCVSEGKRSRITPDGGATTLMAHSPYYDEEGAYHYHNPNHTDFAYTCSNGHNWQERVYHKCNACGWTGEPKEQSEEAGA